MAPKLIAAALAGLLTVAHAQAGTKIQVPEGESVLTLRVNGELTIDTDGRVSNYLIHTKLDPKVHAMVTKAVPGWRFRPVELDGKPVQAKSPMRITLAAREAKGGYEVRVDNVVFTPNSKAEYEADRAAEKARFEQGKTLGLAGDPSRSRQPVLITSIKMTPPGYPTGMLRAGVEGIVLLNLQLNADGTVAEVFASQSSLLNVKGRPEVLDRARAVLEKNAASVARKWTFRVDAKDPASLRPSDLTVRIPIDYRIGSPRSTSDAEVAAWRLEFRGPNYPVPWLLGGDDESAVGVSDFDGGGEYLAGSSRFGLADTSVIGKTL